MSDIAGERAYVSNLRPTDHAAAFGQAGSVLNNPCVPDDLTVRYTATNNDVLALDIDGIHVRDTRHIHQGFDRSVQTTANFHEQISAATNDTSLPVIALQYVDSLCHRLWRVVVLPAICRGVCHRRSGLVDPRPDVGRALGAVGANGGFVKILQLAVFDNNATSCDRRCDATEANTEHQVAVKGFRI